MSLATMPRGGAAIAMALLAVAALVVALCGVAPTLATDTPTTILSLSSSSSSPSGCTASDNSNNVCSYSVSVVTQVAQPTTAPALTQPIRATATSAYVDRTHYITLDIPFAAFNRTVNTFGVTTNGVLVFSPSMWLGMNSPANKPAPIPSAAAGLPLNDQLAFLSFDLLGALTIRIASTTGRAPLRSQVVRFERNPGHLVVDLEFFETTNAIEVRYSSDTTPVLRVTTGDASDASGATASAPAPLGPVIGIQSKTSLVDYVAMLDGSLPATASTSTTFAWQLAGSTVRFAPTATWIAETSTSTSTTSASTTTTSSLQRREQQRRRRLLMAADKPETVIPPVGAFNVLKWGNNMPMRALYPELDNQIMNENGADYPSLNAAINMYVTPAPIPSSNLGKELPIGFSFPYGGSVYNTVRLYADGVMGLGPFVGCTGADFIGDVYTHTDAHCGPMLAVHKRPGVYTMNNQFMEVATATYIPYSDYPQYKVFRARWGSYVGPNYDRVIVEIELWAISGQVGFNYYSLPRVGTYETAVTALQGANTTYSWMALIYNTTGETALNLNNAGMMFELTQEDYGSLPTTITNGRPCGFANRRRLLSAKEDGEGGASASTTGANGAIAAPPSSIVTGQLAQPLMGSASNVRVSYVGGGATSSTPRVPLPIGAATTTFTLADDDVFTWQLPFVVSPDATTLNTSTVQVSANGYLRVLRADDDQAEQEVYAETQAPFVPQAIAGDGGSGAAQANARMARPFVAFLWADWGYKQRPIVAHVTVLGGAHARVALLRFTSGSDMDVDVLVYEGTGRIEVRYYGVPIIKQPLFIGWQNVGDANDWTVAHDALPLVGPLYNALVGSVVVFEVVAPTAAGAGAAAGATSGSGSLNRLRRLLQQPTQSSSAAAAATTTSAPLPACTAPSVLFLRRIADDSTEPIVALTSLLANGTIVASNEQRTITAASTTMTTCDVGDFVFTVPPVELSGAARVPLDALRSPIDESAYTATTYSVHVATLPEADHVPLGTLQPIHFDAKLANNGAVTTTTSEILLVELHGPSCATSQTFYKVPVIVSAECNE